MLVSNIVYNVGTVRDWKPDTDLRLVFCSSFAKCLRDIATAASEEKDYTMNLLLYVHGLVTILGICISLFRQMQK